MTLKRDKKDKNKLRLRIIIVLISFLIFKAIIFDWEHFKTGIKGGF